MLNRLLRFIFIVTAFFPIVSFGDDTYLSDKDKDEFIRRGVPACVANQKKHPTAKFIDPKDMEFYCTCTMTRSTDFLTIEDLGRVFQNKSFEHLKPIMELTGSYCMKVVLKKWGMDIN